MRQRGCMIRVSGKKRSTHLFAEDDDATTTQSSNRYTVFPTDFFNLVAGQFATNFDAPPVIVRFGNYIISRRRSKDEDRRMGLPSIT